MILAFPALQRAFLTLLVAGPGLASALEIEPLGAHGLRNNPLKLPAATLTLSQYTQVWSDEFDRPIPYKHQYYWGDEGINKELQVYLDTVPATHSLTGKKEPLVIVRDGQLHLRAVKLKKPYTNSHGQSFRYASSMITTEHRHAWKYGLFMARIRMPQGIDTRGLWPAFWLLPEDHDAWNRRGGYNRMPEMDVMEWLGQTPTEFYATLHTRTPRYIGGWNDTPVWDGTWGRAGWDVPENQRRQTGGKWQALGTRIDTELDLRADFHTYAIDWEPDAITWYFDGTPVKIEPTPADASTDPGLARYFIINLAVGGSWPGKPGAGVAFPTELTVDWVRIYQRKAEARPVPPKLQ